MKILGKVPMQRFNDDPEIMKTFIVGEMIFEEDNNGHVHNVPRYFKEPISKEEYEKVKNKITLHL